MAADDDGHPPVEPARHRPGARPSSPQAAIQPTASPRRASGGGRRSTLDRPSGPLGDAVLGLFRVPVLGETLYHALVSRAGIRYYLEKMAYHDPALVTEGVIEDYHRAGHEPGSRHFPASFIAGKLNLGISDLWPRVPHKSLVCWGQKAETVPLSDINNFTRNNPRSEPRVFRDAALLPHVERAETFNEEVRKFLMN